jgi:hypothetical protein
MLHPKPLPFFALVGQRLNECKQYFRVRENDNEGDLYTALFAFSGAAWRPPREKLCINLVILNLVHIETSCKLHRSDCGFALVVIALLLLSLAVITPLV